MPIEHKIQQIHSQLTSVLADAENTACAGDPESDSARSDVLSGIRSALFCLETAQTWAGSYAM